MRTFFGVIVISHFLIGPPRAHADVKVVDDRGHVVSVPWATRTNWVWRENAARAGNDAEPNMTPVRVIWFNMDKKSFEVVKDASPPNIHDNSDDSPFKQGYSIGVEEKGNVPWVMVREQGQQERALVVVADPEPGVLLAHETCQSEEISITQTGAEKVGLDSVGIYCQESHEGLALYLFMSRPVKLKARTPGKITTRTKRWARVFIKTPSFGWSEPINLLDASFADRDTGKSLGSISVKINPVPEDRRFSYSVGASLTYLNYKEEPLAVSVSGMFASLKGGAQYHLVPGRWEIDGSAYINIAPVYATSTPENISRPRFWGLNARLAYTLPLVLPNYRFRVMLGPYAWGMMVPDSSYGIGSLYGGQVFLQGQLLAMGRPFAYGYLKFAPIGQSMSAVSRFVNYEAAIGGGWRIARVKKRYPIFLGIDATYLKVGEVKDAANTVKLNTISVGTSLGF